MNKLLSTKEVAQLLNVNEKMVYTLISEQGLPATRITGKWLFPAHLVEQWVESKTINYPKHPHPQGARAGVLLIAGSDDLLFDRVLSLFMQRHPDHLALFANLGSLGGLRALRQGRCQMATSHLAQDDGEYNFAVAARELDEVPAVVNFCRREFGLLLPAGNPRNVRSVSDIASAALRVVNRPPGTSTRLRFDAELHLTGIEPEAVPGYEREVPRHLDVGLEILAGRADAGLAIRGVAGLLGLDFLPLGSERFDLIVPKETFFTPAVQLFLEALHQGDIRSLASTFTGYDMSFTGRIVHPPAP